VNLLEALKVMDLLGGDLVPRSVDLNELMESRRELMNIHITTAADDVSVNMLDELQINDTDLDSDFRAIPGQIAFWVALSARCKSVLELARRGYDDWYAPLYEQAFSQLQAATGKKPNINSADNKVRLSHRDEYNKRNVGLDNAEADLKTVTGMVQALEMKMQMLIQISKRQLSELGHTSVGFASSYNSNVAPHPQQQASNANAESSSQLHVAPIVSPQQQQQRISSGNRTSERMDDAAKMSFQRFAKKPGGQS